MSGLAETLAIVGDDATSRKALAMAIEAAKGIDTPVAKSRAMGAIAESLAEAGDIGAAFNTAESISIPAVRARAYIHLADSKGVGGKGPRKPHP